MFIHVRFHSQKAARWSCRIAFRKMNPFTWCKRPATIWSCSIRVDRTAKWTHPWLCFVPETKTLCSTRTKTANSWHAIRASKRTWIIWIARNKCRAICARRAGLVRWTIGAASSTKSDSSSNESSRNYLKCVTIAKMRPHSTHSINSTEKQLNVRGHENLN